MTGSQGDDDALSTPRANVFGTDDGVAGVVAALDDHIGSQGPDQLEGSVLVEHRDGVHGLESGEHIGTIGFRAYGALGPLQAANARVAVETHDECVTTFTRAAQDVEVSRVKQVEDAVGEDDAPALLLAPALRAGPVVDLPSGIEGAQKELSARGSKRISRT